MLLAKTFGMNVIAEGIETIAQWDACRSLGVHFAQGFLVGRPMPARVVGDWLKTIEPHIENSITLDRSLEPIAAIGQKRPAYLCNKFTRSLAARRETLRPCSTPNRHPTEPTRHRPKAGCARVTGWPSKRRAVGATRHTRAWNILKSHIYDSWLVCRG